MDKKHKKKLKRANKKKKEKRKAQDAAIRMKSQLTLFSQLPEQCSGCNKDFPKTREAHMSWRVSVRNQEKLVRLFCPDCQQQAKELADGQSNEI